jgi:HEPN domain-containing protein
MNAPRAEARRWWQQAQADLAVVRTLRSAGHHAATCFQSQQAAEKALKAALFAHGARVVLGHSVRELARQCAEHDAAFAGVAEHAALLDQFYIATRYPNGLPFPAVPSEAFTNAQAHTAQDAAEQIVTVVEAYLRAHTDVLD